MICASSRSVMYWLLYLYGTSKSQLNAMSGRLAHRWLAG
jgi:hypothetical protein